jgi:hypothetical protein
VDYPRPGLVGKVFRLTYLARNEACGLPGFNPGEPNLLSEE